jgi:hypothetical protein
VWEDHLLPLLTGKDAARLGCTCKAMRGLVREHFKDIVGMTIKVEQLRGALTTFPRARTVALHPPSHYPMNDEEVEALVQWLREGERGRSLERVTIIEFSGNQEDFVHEALQAGALPSIKNLSAELWYETQLASLTGGHVAAMHELEVLIDCMEDDDEAFYRQLAALGLVRQLPALTKLEVRAYGYRDEPVPQWPPFIPPSLISLGIELEMYRSYNNESLLRALPGMLEASGARLERLEVILPSSFEAIGDGLVHVAQALRCCSSTLKEFRLTTEGRTVIRIEDGQEARLREQWADVMAGVSACRELQVLVLPHIKVESLFPPGTAFRRLTHLEISDHEREHPPDAGVMGLWELVASGGLPALAKLDISFEGRWGGVEEVRSRVVPAFEAMAGTLTHLYLETYGCEWSSDEVNVMFELGVAVGKLRRLMDLSLGVSEDGLVYHAVAQGLAAGGGEYPLPLLWRVWLAGGASVNVDLLVSLLLPSVRVFITCLRLDRRAPLMVACALRQAGYKHTWEVRFPFYTWNRVVEIVAACKRHIKRVDFRPLWR